MSSWAETAGGQPNDYTHTKNIGSTWAQEKDASCHVAGEVEAGPLNAISESDGSVNSLYSEWEGETAKGMKTRCICVCISGNMPKAKIRSTLFNSGGKISRKKDRNHRNPSSDGRWGTVKLILGRLPECPPLDWVRTGQHEAFAFPKDEKSAICLSSFSLHPKVPQGKEWFSVLKTAIFFHFEWVYIATSFVMWDNQSS